ncbi:MAG: hypothetical protein ACRBCJ_01310 [Hyphomicrobiaceae bacterium]
MECANERTSADVVLSHVANLWANFKDYKDKLSIKKCHDRKGCGETFLIYELETPTPTRIQWLGFVQ